MMTEYVRERDLHWFVCFFLFIVFRWAVVFLFACRYKNYSCKNKKLFTTVIVPVVDEPVNFFKKVLSRIFDQAPDELIVVVNGPRDQALLDACEEFCQAAGDTTIKTIYTPVAGKRNAIRLGMEASDKSSNITILVDSDTLWTKNTLKELLRPFSADEKIGGVTTRQRIYRPERSLFTMFANLIEEIRAEGTMKAMSSTGKVGCLPGRTIAFRTEILRKAMPEFVTETFMGIHPEISDDRSLTNLTLKMGYKTVLQDTSVVYTDAPVSLKQFVKQQIRWAAGSQYNNLRMTPWMNRNAPLMAFIYWTDMLMPIMLISVYVNTILCITLTHMGIQIQIFQYSGPWWISAILLIAGSVLSFGTRQFKVFSRLPTKYFLLIPVFIFLLGFLMAFIRIVGLMRCADEQPWGTRNNQRGKHEL